MKKRTSIFVGIFLLIVVVFLNRSYAHIYNEIGNAHLQSPAIKSSYQFGDNSKKILTYVAVGDSLTTGVGVDLYNDSYPYQLAQKLSQKQNSILLKTFAIQGARSKTILTFVDDIVQSNPDIITILLGVNDVHGNISEKEFQSNYDQILKRLTTETHAKIYIINIPYIGSTRLIYPPYTFYFNHKTQQFNDILKSLSARYNLEYIDLYTQVLPFDTEKLYYSKDMFHPSKVGYTLWASKIYESFNF